ncbi:hypothetical protein TNCV_2286521 [Trichonephila clavipes]|nr:hypothetical protein TNCV_2286521 [Trichonephila clavipes]
MLYDDVINRENIGISWVNVCLEVPYRIENKKKSMHDKSEERVSQTTHLPYPIQPEPAVALRKHHTLSSKWAGAPSCKFPWYLEWQLDCN